MGTTYNVYMHNVPKVSEDGKVIPIAPHRMQEFSELEEAQKFAEQHKDDFERVTLMRLSEDKKRLIERYIDGEHEINDKPEEEPEETAEAAAADEAAEEGEPEAAAAEGEEPEAAAAEEAPEKEEAEEN